MKSLRFVVTVAFLLIAIVLGFLWWNQPERVDMSAYVPADSLVYLEFNSLIDVAKTLEQNDTWKKAAQAIGTDSRLVDPFWTRLARTGAAPLTSVVLTRAQFAVVLVGMNSVEEGDTLRVRPEVAVVVETHTANWRIKSAAANALRNLATHAYGQSSCSERDADAHYIECSSAASGRKLVAAVDGSVVIVGNTDNAVRSCLDVRRGSRPSLQTDSELQRLRSQFQTGGAISFGYVSSSNVAKIFSWAAPLLMGRAPGDTQLEKLLTTSAGKILRSIAWSTRPAGGEIEDRYLISLDSDVVSRLEPAFATSSIMTDVWKYLPQAIESVTIYRSQDPLNALNSLNSALAHKLDALSSVMFSSLLRSSLAVYGVDNPAQVLPLLSSPLVTLRGRPEDESSVLLAHVSDQTQLKRALESQTIEGGIQVVDGVNGFGSNNQRAFTAIMLDGSVVMGKTESVRSWVEVTRDVNREEPKWFQTLKQSDNAITFTYADDNARVRSLVATMTKLRGTSLSTEQMSKVIDATKTSSFSITESKLNSTGIERTTRSPFGQISTLFSLLQSDTVSDRP